MVGNLLTEFARLLMSSLADAGVRDVVVSPGSRSTPYVVAAVREPRLRCHSVIDERAAAFFALGQARVAGRPSVLLCTSGSAAAHYFPAVVEAAMAYVPLLVVTADRPPDLHDCHAPQTIDQVKLYGDYARGFFDLLPEGSEDALRAVRRVAAQSTLTTRWPVPGPVHLNARAAKPLEPTAATTPEEKAFAEVARRVADEPLTAAFGASTQPPDEAVSHAAELCRSAKRGVIVCGPAPVARAETREAIAALARTAGFPVWAEATSQLRFSGGIENQVDAFDWLLRAPSLRDRVAPDFVLQIGAPPISSAWEARCRAIPRIVLSSHGWQDPWSSARAILFGDDAASARALAASLDGAAVRSEYAETLRAANARAWDAIDRDLANGTFHEGTAVREILERAPSGSLISLGNSLAVRLVDSYCKHGASELDVLSQRGASGIDGLVAGAVGASLQSDRPVTLLLGDVSLLHDLGSLSLTSRARAPLAIVVLNNAGGRIFEQLPISRAAGIEPEILDLTLTPHGADFRKAAALFALSYASAASGPDLASALGAAYGRNGPTLIEVTLRPHGAAEAQARISAVVDAR
jgi:2-succinyl-5-enolpyruvyl-6-hydroxy-3-cyclohexene-1-carboxylate synthase